MYSFLVRAYKIPYNSRRMIGALRSLLLNKRESNLTGFIVKSSSMMTKAKLSPRHEASVKRARRESFVGMANCRFRESTNLRFAHAREWISFHSYVPDLSKLKSGAPTNLSTGQ